MNCRRSLSTSDGTSPSQQQGRATEAGDSPVEARDREVGGRASAATGGPLDHQEATRTAGIPARSAPSCASGSPKGRPATPSGRSCDTGGSTCVTRPRRASGTRALQSPVHGKCGAAREAGTTPGARAEQRSGRDHRAGGDREARAARGEALRQVQGAAEVGGRNGHLGGFTVHSSPNQTHRVRTRWQPL